MKKERIFFFFICTVYEMDPVFSYPSTPIKETWKFFRQLHFHFFDI